MSIQAVAWALDQDIPDPAAKLVLICLCDAFNQERQRCFPTIRHLMKGTSSSERTVQRKLAVLADLGFISIEKVMDETGRQRANEYRLFMNGEGATVTGEGVNLTGVGCQIDGGEGVTLDGGEGVSCDTPLKKPEEIPEERTLGAPAPPKPAAPDPFEEFWQAYPNRTGPNPKKPAKAKFEKLCAGGEDPARIIAAARRLSRNHPKATPYVPQAVTWLNQERFADDEVGAAPAGSAIGDEQWAKRLGYARRQREWALIEWGPMPGTAGCRVPAHLLAPGDGAGWTAQREAA